MLLWLANWLMEYHAGFRVLQFLTFRVILAILTSLLLAFIIWPFILVVLNKLKLGQSIRELGPSSHQVKAGTPTMGGLLIILCVTISTLLWTNLANAQIILALLITILFATIGFMDDYLKIKYSNSVGLKSRYKFGLQGLFALAFAIYLYLEPQLIGDLFLLIPYVKDTTVYLGGFFIVLTFFVLVGSSNAVNLTDGLDGLAIMPSVLVLGALGIFAYLSGNIVFAKYLGLPYLPGSGELTVFCATFIGAGLGFLWFNTYPAQVFMGDIGSLSIGAAMGAVAVLIKQEIILFIAGGIFVVETLSVILQVMSFKLTGKRMFNMAPLHHHFELKGWAEPKVIVRFWIISFILVLIALASIKVR